MGIYDRDWYKEDYQRREKEYGGDFSLQSKKLRHKANRNSNAPYKAFNPRKFFGMNILTIIAGIIPVVVLCYGNFLPWLMYRFGVVISVNSLFYTADAAAVGRSMMPSLESKGKEGVIKFISGVGNELRYIMSSTGFEHVSDIDSSVLYEL